MRLSWWKFHTVAVLLTMALGSQAQAQYPQERRGFWFGFGAGYGSVGCDDCEDRSGSASGYIKLGGTLSRKLLLGFEANGWAKTHDDATLSFLNGNAVLYVYPASGSGFHFKAGLGFSSVSYQFEAGNATVTVDRSGAGGILGLGWDVRIGRNISLVPFANVLGGTFSEDGERFTFNHAQLGLGLTIH
jgi:hypothetical protein